MLAEHILRQKGRETITIGPDDSLASAVDTLSEHRIGALVVTDDDGAVVGVLSERDVVDALSEHGGDALGVTVREAMGGEAPTCEPGDEVQELMAFVTRRRVRHLPVVENGAVNGVISVGDLLKTRLKEMETEKQVLQDRLLDC
jgi:CBS domain-containing protein